MASANLLALLDDIVTILDDVATMTKVATSKTAGVLGDDLALNAQQVSGVRADRELPVIWKVAKGSFRNKLILVPAALAISFFVPWLIKPLLMLGGAFLCFEGVEKLYHKFFEAHKEEQQAKKLIDTFRDPNADLVEFEKEKIQGAIRTDFILSAEIIVISLGTVATKGFAMQFAVLSSVAVLMTIGVYGLVAGIIKLDDLGSLLLRQTKGSFLSLKHSAGKGLLLMAPLLLKVLSVLGTLAMFLVGGGIIVHGVPQLHHFTEESVLIVSIAVNLVTGILVGIVALMFLKIKQKIQFSGATKG